MKNILLTVLLLIFTMTVSGCGESMFNAGGNSKSPEAMRATIQKAFMDKDYDTILNLYSSDNYTYFSDEAVHNYAAALLGKGGFDVLNGVDLFFGNNTNTDDMYSMFYTLIGIDNTTDQNNILNIKGYFDLAANVCNTAICTRAGGTIDLIDNISICSQSLNNVQNLWDNNTAFVCTLSGGFGTVTNLSNTVQLLADKAGLSLSIKDITSQAGIGQAVKQIEQSGADLSQLVGELTDNELKDLAVTLNTLDTNLSSLENIIGTVNGADQILKDLKDDATRSFTVQSLKDGLTTYLPSINGTGGVKNINRESGFYEY